MAEEQELKASLRLGYLPLQKKTKKPKSVSPAWSTSQYKTKTAWQIQYLQTIPQLQAFQQQAEILDCQYQVKTGNCFFHCIMAQTVHIHTRTF